MRPQVEVGYAALATGRGIYELDLDSKVRMALHVNHARVVYAFNATAVLVWMDCIEQEGHRRREHGNLASPAAGRYRGRQDGEPAPAIPQGRVAFDGRVPAPQGVRSTATTREEGRPDAGSRIGKGTVPTLST